MAVANFSAGLSIKKPDSPIENRLAGNPALL